MAKLDPTPYPMAPYSVPDGEQVQDVAMENLQAVSDALPPGEVVGGILRFPMADGYAIYRVTKAKPLTLQYVPWADAWQIPYAHIRGLRLQDVQTQLEQSARRRQLFGKGKT